MSDLDEAMDVISDLLRQSCSARRVWHGALTFSTGCNSTYADAASFLIDHSRAALVKGSGRCFTFWLVDKETP